MSNFVKSLVERNGFEVIGQAENGISGVSLFKELHPDLVTMDIAMPQMDGIQSLKQILKLDPNAKVLIVSSMTHGGMVREALHAGAIKFIAKPFDPTNLIEELNRLSAC